MDLNDLEAFKNQFGVTEIDVVTFSHYHDDHLIRSQELLRDGNTKFWVFEKMLDVIENPTRYRLPCLVPFPIRADRVLHDGERIRWQEYELQFFHLPGQTEFHQGLFAIIDGQRVLFTGDNTWKKIDPARVRNGPLVPQNEYFLDGGFITCAQKMLDYQPDIVCPAHTEEYSPTREDLEEFLAWGMRVRDTMTNFIDQPDPNFGMDYRWCHLYPYRSFPTDDSEFEIEVVIRNHLSREARAEVVLQLPEDVTAETATRTVTIPPKVAVALPFRLRRIDNLGKRRIITADVVINDHHFGEIAEAIID